MTMFIRRRVALFANPQQLKFNLPVASVIDRLAAM
jgi:hypothetical protein